MESFEAIGKSFAGYGTDAQVSVEGKISRLEGFDQHWDKRVKKNPYFRLYMKKLFKQRDVEPPQLVDSLGREMGIMENPNLIYPVGDPVFIHIFVRGKNKDLIYKPIEPRLFFNRDWILAEVEKRVALSIDENIVFKTAEEKTEYLNELLKTFIVVNKKAKPHERKPDEEKDKNKGFLSRLKRDDKGKIELDPLSYEMLKYEVYCEKVGSSILEPFIRDIYIEDIHCSGLGPIYIDHKIFKTMESTIALEESEELDGFALKLSEIVGKPASHREPIIDAKMPDGSRLNLVYGEDVSTRGSNFTIRKFATNPISICQIINWGTMSSLAAAYIWMLLENKMSLWICGETASGKTTTLSALMTFMPRDYKIVSIEEVPEVHVPHKNWIREVVRDTANSGSEEGVTMFALLKAALRQRPTYIIVGEVRGAEGNIAFQAMQTGHPSIATFHAATVGKLVQRLTNFPISVPKTHVDNLNAALFQSAVNDYETGKYKRRVLSINEILGYEPADQAFNFVEVFSFDPSTDKVAFRGLGTSYLLDNKIAVMKGYTGMEVKKIYDELYMRAEILEYMIALGVLEYEEVFDQLLYVQGIGIEQAHARLRRQALMKLGHGIESVIKKKVSQEN
ncbi:type II/IV secretion system ATPase subunit [Candidatus Bathyarchaeota archaeon]|nr:type II/IV secretion system ATPase subunit [Candidatus Bathyarchaeota archaeon]